MKNFCFLITCLWTFIGYSVDFWPFEHAGKDQQKAIEKVSNYYNGFKDPKKDTLIPRQEHLIKKWVAVSEDKDGNYIMDGKTYSKDDKTVNWVTETVKDEKGNVVKDEKGNEKVKVIGAWVDYIPSSVDADKPTYIFSHGLNDKHNAQWISDSASLIQKGQKPEKDEDGNVVKDKEPLILSVNWDKYSGTPDDKNFMASTWINAVSYELSKQLAPLNNIKSFVGHSYGTHLLASTAVLMSKNGTLKEDRISFIALDPAEETATWTGDKDGNFTWIWEDDKKSKGWGLPANITSEVYKSSAIWGSEETLGDYNYLLAETGAITPRGVLGDLKQKGIAGNHSQVSTDWLVKMLKNNLKNNQMHELLGGWFNQEVDSQRGKTHTKWDGVVNATVSVKQVPPSLEYIVDANKVITDWQDVFVAEAQSKLGSKSEWENTVLKPGAYTLFKLFHGNAKVGETACDTSQMAAIKTSDDTITVYDANDDQYYNYTISTGKIEKINASSENVLDDINEAINGNGASTTNENSITGSIDSVTNDNADIENAINGVLNSKNNSSTKLDKIIEKGKELVNKYITLDNVKKVAQKALDKLLERYPAVNKIIQKLGDIIKYGKDLFKLVKGLLGGENFINLLKNCSMLKNLLAGGIQKIGELLKNIVGNLATNLISKLCNFVSKAVNNLLSKVSNFKLDPEQIKKWIENAIDKTLDKATTWVSPRVDSFSLSDGNDESKNSNNSSSSGASILGGQQSVNAN